MNDKPIKRYSEFYTLRNGDGAIDAFGIKEAHNGRWVSYEDYAKLKAEVERLRAKQTDIDRVQAQSDFFRSKLINGTEYTANVQLIDKVKHLEAQIERLTKAGDAMDALIMSEIYTRKPYFCFVPGDVKEWRAAKEGKQS